MRLLAMYGSLMSSQVRKATAEIAAKQSLTFVRASVVILGPLIIALSTKITRCITVLSCRTEQLSFGSC